MKIAKFIYPLTLILVVICAWFSVSIAKAETFPNFPMAFWGNITINGSPAPIGTVIRAYYGAILAGQAIVQEPGIYGYTEATKQKLVVAEGTGQITFKVQQNSLNGGNETEGSDQQSYVVFESAITKNIDFAFTLPIIPIVPSIQGGGGGATLAPAMPIISTSSTAISKVDANRDGRINIFDFNLLMIQWGIVGSGNTCDFNGDGKVDIFDFNNLMINWSK